jgi:hypothetical protein
VVFEEVFEKSEVEILNELLVVKLKVDIVPKEEVDTVNEVLVMTEVEKAGQIVVDAVVVKSRFRFEMVDDSVAMELVKEVSGESNFVVKLTSKEGDNLSEVAAADDAVEVEIVGNSLLAELDADEVIIIDSDVDVV